MFIRVMHCKIVSFLVHEPYASSTQKDKPIVYQQTVRFHTRCILNCKIWVVAHNVGWRWYNRCVK